MVKRFPLIAVGLIGFLLGCLVTQPLPLVQAQQDNNKAPQWLHGLNLGCRKSKEADFTKETQKYGIEVFRDMNNGNLIYIAENGSIAVVPGK